MSATIDALRAQAAAMWSEIMAPVPMVGRIRADVEPSRNGVSVTCSAESLLPHRPGRGVARAELSRDVLREPHVGALLELMLDGQARQCPFVRAALEKAGK